jgi:hypothetical protein
MTTEKEEAEMAAMLRKAGDGPFLWLLSPYLKHALYSNKAAGYVSRAADGKPDTFLGVPIVVVLKQRHCQLVRPV